MRTGQRFARIRRTWLVPSPRICAAMVPRARQTRDRKTTRKSTRAVVMTRTTASGVRSNTAGNFYVSTSIENTVAAFALALEAELSRGFEVCNVADGHVDPGIVDVQAFLQAHWPSVPNHTRGNEGLLSIDQARQLLGYAPIREGTYYPLSLIWG